MRQSQLSLSDTANYSQSRGGTSSDWVMFWVFDAEDGDRPGPDDITEHLAGRLGLLAEFDRKIVDVPGQVDYPYWIAADRAPASFISRHGADRLEWSACMEQMGSLIAVPLDATVEAAHLHVFGHVVDAPTSSGSGIVVMLKVSHALMVGPSMPAVSEALFGAGATEVSIPGLPPAASRFSPAWAAARGVGRTPFSLARYAKPLVSNSLARRFGKAREDGEDREDTASPAAEATTPTRFSRFPGDDRTMRTFRLDRSAMQVSGLSVTAVGLAAVSSAMQTYLTENGEACPENLSSIATVALGEAAHAMGVNRIGAAVVDLHPELEPIEARGHSIQSSLRTAQAGATSERALANLQYANSMPFILYRSFVLPGILNAQNFPPPANTLMTSIRCDVSPLSLCGRGLAFSGMLQALAPNIALAHSIVGVGDSIGVSVLSSNAVLPDIDRYVDLLRTAFDEFSDE